jgi:NAD dependent epimerase/dehydratase family enzyme
MKGVYNAVSPEFSTYKEFTMNLANVLKKPLWFPNIPSIIMKLIFGEMSIILLEGSRISADKIINEGFRFKFQKLNSALIDLLRNKI